MAPPTVVDTSVFVDFLRRPSGPVRRRMEELATSRQALLCGPVEEELVRGAREQSRAGLLEELGHFGYLQAEREDFIACGDLRRSLGAKGITLSQPDGLIAALCLRRGLTLLTLDSDFKRIPGLKLETP